jgi:hypothetical protein
MRPASTCCSFRKATRVDAATPTRAASRRPAARGSSTHATSGARAGRRHPARAGDAAASLTAPESLATKEGARNDTAVHDVGGGGGYLMSVSILNIGKYIEMMITPTISPTPIIMIGSMIEVSVWIDESTSSS